MGAFELVRSVHASPNQVWRVVTDWPRHGQALPLTRVRVDDGRPGVGSCFTGLSGIGRLRFADPMSVIEWEPPTEHAARGWFRIRKTGRLLDGWAVVVIEPAGDGRSTLRWLEDITVRPRALGRLLAPLVDRGSRLMFGHALDSLVAQAEAQAEAEAEAQPEAQPLAQAPTETLPDPR